MARLLAKLGIPWPYATRTIGAFMLAYGLLVDKSDERGTIILAAVGFLGYEFVGKSEPKNTPPKENGTK